MKKIDVEGVKISVINNDNQDYLSLTDMIKAKDGDFFMADWLRNRNTVEFLGIWESINNPNFNYGEFAIIKSRAGLNSYKISVDGKNKKFERPVLILKKFNKHLILIIPLSSKIKEGKFYYYKFSKNNKNFVSAMICQIRLISSKRLIRKMGTINNNDYKEIKLKIKSFL